MEPWHIGTGFPVRMVQPRSDGFWSPSRQLRSIREPGRSRHSFFPYPTGGMHTEALTKEGLILLPTLPALGPFYLAGGTALALQIGHRVSVDFDFFSPEPIAGTLLTKAQRIFAPEPLTP